MEEEAMAGMQEAARKVHASMSEVAEKLGAEASKAVAETNQRMDAAFREQTDPEQEKRRLEAIVDAHKAAVANEMVVDPEPEVPMDLPDRDELASGTAHPPGYSQVLREVFRCTGRLENILMEIRWEDGVGEVADITLRWGRIDDMRWPAHIPLLGETIAGRLDTRGNEIAARLFLGKVIRFMASKYDDGPLELNLYVGPVKAGASMGTDLLTCRSTLTLAVLPEAE